MVAHRHLLFSVVIALAIAGLTHGVAPAAAQSETTPEAAQLQNLLKEFKAELDRGEKERLIDPWYLRDLRNLLGRYENPWNKRLFSDDFSQRGPDPAPPWKVTAGEFLIDWRFGLRTVITQQAQAQPQAQKKSSDKDAAKQLFGQILSQALTGQQQEQEQQAPTQPGFSAAVAPVAISNAFAIRVEMTARPVQTASARFEFGPFQGQNATAGYRLAYIPDAGAGAASLELLSLSTRGTSSILELYNKPLKLEDGNSHVIKWTRTAAGRMVIRVDGTEVMAVTDRRFSAPFDGIALINSGGDYALRSLTVDGAG